MTLDVGGGGGEGTFAQFTESGKNPPLDVFSKDESWWVGGGGELC